MSHILPEEVTSRAEEDEQEDEDEDRLLASQQSLRARIRTLQEQEQRVTQRLNDVRAARPARDAARPGSEAQAVLDALRIARAARQAASSQPPDAQRPYPWGV